MTGMSSVADSGLATTRGKSYYRWRQLEHLSVLPLIVLSKLLLYLSLESFKAVESPNEGTKEKAVYYIAKRKMTHIFLL